MDRRLLALAVLLVGLAGCGAEPEPPPPKPAPPPEVRATENQGELKAASWRAAAAAEARRARTPARRDPPRAPRANGHRRPALRPPHREHLARRPRAPHARLQRRAARARPSDRHARRRAAHGPDDGQRPRLAAPALPRPAAADVPDPAPQHGVLDARAVPGRLPADDVRPRPGGVPVLPRPRAAAPAPRELGQGQLAGAPVPDAPHASAPPCRLPGARAAPHRRPAARARRPARRLPRLGALLQLGRRHAAVDQRDDAGDRGVGARARFAGTGRAALARRGAPRARGVHDAAAGRRRRRRPLRHVLVLARPARLQRRAAGGQRHRPVRGAVPARPPRRPAVPDRRAHGARG